MCPSQQCLELVGFSFVLFLVRMTFSWCQYGRMVSGGISLFSLLMATSSLSILYSITSLASFLLSASGLHFSLCMMLPTLDLFVIVCYISSRSSLHCLHLVYMYISLCIWVPDCTSIFYQWTCKSEICLFFYPDWWDFQVSMQEAKSFICFAGNIIYVLVPL